MSRRKKYLVYIILILGIVAFVLNGLYVFRWNDTNFEAMVRILLDREEGFIPRRELNAINEMYIYGEVYISETDESNSMSDFEYYNLKIFKLALPEDNYKSYPYNWGNIKDISDIAKLKNLRKLVIKYNRIEHIPKIRGGTKLEYLDLSYNYLHDIENTDSYKNLRELNLSNNNVWDLNSLVQMDKLEALDISSTMVHDLKPLGNLENLHKLKIFFIPIYDIDELVYIQSLTHLWLFDDFHYDFSKLLELKNLKYVETSFCAIDDLPKHIEQGGDIRILLPHKPLAFATDEERQKYYDENFKINIEGE